MHPGYIKTLDVSQPGGQKMKIKTSIVGVAFSALLAIGYLQWSGQSEPMASMADCPQQGCNSPLIAGFKGLYLP